MALRSKTVFQDFQSEEFLSIIRCILDILKSCIGPNGGVQIIVTGGGISVVTSASSRLLNNYLNPNPVCVLLTQVMKSQNSSFGDYGLYIGVLVCNLLERMLKQNMMEQTTASKLLQSWCSEICNLLESNSIKLVLDFSTVKQLIPLVKTILTSKPACGLSKKEVEALSVQIVKIFLNTVKDDFGEIVVVNNTQSDETESVYGLSYQLENNDEFVRNLLEEVSKLDSKGIPVLLFNIMLTHTESQGGNEDKVVLEKEYDGLNEAKAVLEQAVALGVKIIGCQKVVHDSLKFFLQRQKIILLDRLGSELCDALEKLSGAKVISALENAALCNLQSFIGTVDSASLITKNHRSYVVLQKKDSTVATLHVCCPTKEAFAETKVVIHQALNALRQVTCRPYVFPGSGCLEAWLATQLKVKFLQSLCLYLGFCWIIPHLALSLQKVRSAQQICEEFQL